MPQPPTGIARRRRRISDAETERRMLDAGVDLVNRSGLTVSLEHLSFEEVIAAAKVSRSTVYRRWPYKDLYFSDLLRELAKAASPAAVTTEAEALRVIGTLIRASFDDLTEGDRRDALVLELVRVGAAHDFELMRASVEWRTYLALQATFLSVVDESLRADLQATLRETDASFMRGIAAAWRRLCQLLGYRIRPTAGVTFETIARLLSADLRGHVLLALADPAAASSTVQAQPDRALSPAPWSLPALSAAAIAQACLEPDPDVTWDAERLDMVRGALRALVPE